MHGHFKIRYSQILIKFNEWWREGELGEMLHNLEGNGLSLANDWGGCYAAPMLDILVMMVPCNYISDN